MEVPPTLNVSPNDSANTPIETEVKQSVKDSISPNKLVHVILYYVATFAVLLYVL